VGVNFVLSAEGARYGAEISRKHTSPKLPNVALSLLGTGTRPYIIMHCKLLCGHRLLLVGVEPCAMPVLAACIATESCLSTTSHLHRLHCSGPPPQGLQVWLRADRWRMKKRSTAAPAASVLSASCVRRAAELICCWGDLSSFPA
jgi:hypothetical protein